MRGHGLLTSCVLVAFVVPSLAGAQADSSQHLTGGVRSLKSANAGEIWEQTTEVAGGLGGPSHTSLECIEKGSFSPPKEEDEEGDCKVADLRRSGNKATWRSVCENGVAGDGEMTWQSDTFTGSTKLQGAGMAMSVRFRGRKLGGNCDPKGYSSETEQRKQQNDALKQMSAAQLSRTCEEWARNVNPLALIYDECRASRPAFSEQLSRSSGFARVTSFPSPLPNEIFEACGKTREGALAEIRARECPGRLRDLQPKDGWYLQPPSSGGDPWRALPLQTEQGLKFIEEWCPDQQEQLAKRECAGRQPCKTISHGEDGDETICKGNVFPRWIYGFCVQRLVALANGTPAAKDGTTKTGVAVQSSGGAAARDGSAAKATSFQPRQNDESDKKEKPPADEGAKRELIKRGKAIFGF